MNGALFLFDSPDALKLAIETGGYSPRFVGKRAVAQQSTENPDKELGALTPSFAWSGGRRAATADLACLQSESKVYLFAERAIHGIGVLDNPPVVLNGNHAFDLTPPGHSTDYPFSLPEHRFVVRFHPTKSTWFEAPVDMDDVLIAGESAMHSLRTMEDRSIAIFDESEARAFEQEVRLANLDQLIIPTPGLSVGTPLSIPAFNDAVGIDDELAVESDLVWRLNNSINVPAFDGLWHSALRQVPASPAKPVRYIDRIDVVARRLDATSGFVAEHAVIEIKRNRATKKDAEQLMRYVEWIANRFHHGRYDRVRAYLVADDFGPRLLSRDFRQVTKRLYTVNPRRPSVREWSAASLVRISAVSQSQGYSYERVAIP